MADQNQNQIISDKSLKFGLWYIRRKILLKKIFLVIFIIAIIAVYLFAIARAVQILILQRKEYFSMMQSLSQNLIDYETFRQKFSPQVLQVAKISMIPSHGGRKDVIVQVMNKNEKHMAREVAYRLVSQEKTIAEGKTFIWPNSERFILALGLPESSLSGGIRVEFPVVNWIRVLNFKDMAKEKMDFKIQNIIYTPSVIKNEKIPFASVGFTAINQTVFNYWDVGFSVILWTGGDIVGAGYTQFHTFKSMEKQNADVKILSLSPGYVSRVEILPEINFLDEKSFIGIEEIIGELK